MIKNWKKTCSLLLAIIMVIAMMVGCQQKAPVQNSTTPTTTTTPKDEQPTPVADKYQPIEGKKYTISWLAAQQAPPDEDGEMIKLWEEKFNVDINIVYLATVAGGWEDTLNLKLAAGEIPDVIGQSKFDVLSKMGVLAELPDEALNKYMPNIMNELVAEYPDALKFGIVDGKRLGLLNSIFSAAKFRAPLIYNGQWMKNLGVEKAPETLGEFEDLIYKFSNEDPDKNGKKDTYGLSRSSAMVVFGAYGYMPNYFQWPSLKTGFTVNWSLKDGKLVNPSLQPEMKEALKLLNKWYKDGVLDPEFITGENTGGYFALTQTFMNGRIGVTSWGSAHHWNPAVPGRAIGTVYSELQKANPDLSQALVFGQPPKGPDGKAGIGQQQLITNSYFTLGKQLEKEPDKMGKILQIVDYLQGTFEEDPAFTYFYGIKGKHWNPDANGLPVSVDQYKEAKDLMKIGAWGTFQKFSLAKRTMMLEKEFFKWGTDMGLDKGGIVSPYPSFVALPSGTKYQAELEKIETEAYISIITGDKPIEYFDEFVKKYNSNGGEQLEKEANEWYANYTKK